MDDTEVTVNNEFEPSVEDQPDFLKNIRKKPYFSKVDNTVPLDVNFNPENHFTVNAPVTSDGIYPQEETAEVPKESPTFKEAASAQFKHINDTWHYLHAGFTQLQKPWFSPPDPNFNPLDHQTEIDMVASEYKPYLLASTNKQDFDFRVQRINTEQKGKDDIANGSWAAYLWGGALGMVSDPTNLIPIVGYAKYAKLGIGVLKNITRAIPGAAAYGAVSSTGEALDSINGNFKDAVIDMATKTIFAAGLFGVVGGASNLLEKTKLWESREWLNKYIDGIGVKINVSDKGKIKGYTAYDLDGPSLPGSLSADKVKAAQDKLDSTFSKTGLFGIPYVGDAAIKFLGNRFFGTPIVKIINSKYPTLRMIGDLSYDHGIYTEGIDKGNPNPVKFFTLMKQTHAAIRMQESQINAMHLEANGFKLDNYIAQSAVNAGMLTREKTLEIMSKPNTRPYINREQFLGKVETALYTKKADNNAAVNDAAAFLREVMDKSYKDWREAYNLPEDWMPPRTAEGYLMRVYDTNFMNSNEDKWIQVVSDYLRESDTVISSRMKPIADLEKQINDFKETYTSEIRKLGKGENQKLIGNNLPQTPGVETNTLAQMKARLRAMKETLQDELRSNPKFHLLVDDWHALSHSESQELKALLQPIEDAKQEISDQKVIISELGRKKSSQLSSAKGSTSESKAKPKAEKFVGFEESLNKEKDKLEELEKDLFNKQEDLNVKAQKGEINRKFFTIKDNNISFKDTNDRLKFRDTYHVQGEGKNKVIVDEEEAHTAREKHAKAYFDTITHSTPEDTINQVMGKFTGNASENHTLQRSFLIPDEVLYNNNFMTKDLMAKVANYQTWLNRRTNLKNTYKNVTMEGGFDNILIELNKEFQQERIPLNAEKTRIDNALQNDKLTPKERMKLEKEQSKAILALNKEAKNQKKATETAQFIYQKMMGISKLPQQARSWLSAARSVTVISNLGFIVIAQLGDISANGLQHGVMGLIRDGLYPMITSLGGMKRDSSFFKSAAAVDLGLQHIGAANAEKNMGMATNPYLNMGKIPAKLDKGAQLTSNLSFANFMDNNSQRLSASVIQARIMNIMHDFVNDKATKAEIRWLHKYGLDPKNDAQVFVDQFKLYGGGKTKVGGYQSNFWNWQDFNASNKFSDAVFRGVEDTVLHANVLDTPIWMDENGPINILGPLLKGFRGWSFGSLNRYLIPSLQHMDVQKFMGVLGMLATGALVSPVRRLSRGEDPYPKDMNEKEWAYEVISDSGYLSYFTSILNDANVLTGFNLLKDMKNDRYRERSRAGLLGPVIGDMNNMADIVGMAASREINEHDMKLASRMVPPFNFLWTNGMSNKVIESFGLPKTRAQAHRQKG